MRELSVAGQRYQAALAVIRRGLSVSQVGQRNRGLTGDVSQFVCHRIESAQRVQHVRLVRVRLGG